MKTFTAVNDSMILLDPATLKREALMFERIALPFFRGIAESVMENRSQLPQTLAEIERLMDKGIAFEPEAKLDDERLRASLEFQSYAEAAAEYLPVINESHNINEDDVLAIDAARRKIEITAAGQTMLEAQRAVLSLNARYFSVQLRVLERLDAYPVLSKFAEPVANPSSKKSDVIQIVFNNLPTPDDSTAWEQIFEYRSDKDSYHKFLDLREWITQIARSELSPVEIEQKLEHLISRYQRHMELHRMKVNAGTLQTFVVTTAEIAENLLKLKWGKFAQGLFAIKQRKIALLEGEQSAAGKEIAYILKAREKFGG